MTTFGEAREIVDAFAAALNAKDAEALGELFSDDAEFVNILGMRNA
jgi:ketosteroid isomerase-like protein